MNHAPQVHSQHPFPVTHRLLPQQTACAPHTRIVKDEMRCAPRALHLTGQRLHGGGIAHINLTRHDLGGPQRARLGLRTGQGLRLYIHQYQLHACASRNAHALQTKARTCTGQHSGFT